MPDPIPYDGPLAERAVDIEGLRSFVYVSISADRGPLRSFARKLLKRPIAVRAPGQKYVIWALIGFEYFDRYWIKLATYNLVWPQGGSPFTGDLGLAAEWMWRVLDHHGIADAAQARLGTDRAELVARVREMGPAAIEWVVTSIATAVLLVLAFFVSRFRGRYIFCKGCQHWQRP